MDSPLSRQDILDLRYRDVITTSPGQSYKILVGLLQIT